MSDETTSLMNRYNAAVKERTDSWHSGQLVGISLFLHFAFLIGAIFNSFLFPQCVLAWSIAGVFAILTGLWGFLAISREMPSIRKKALIFSLGQLAVMILAIPLGLFTKPLNAVHEAGKYENVFAPPLWGQILAGVYFVFVLAVLGYGFYVLTKISKLDSRGRLAFKPLFKEVRAYEKTLKGPELIAFSSETNQMFLRDVAFFILAAIYFMTMAFSLIDLLFSL